MSKEQPSNHNAKKQVVGIEYQYYIAVDFLLKLNNWDKCLIEENGDVTFLDDNDNQILNIEVKHHTNENELKLHSEEFQKTIYNWFKDRNKYTEDTKLLLVTTSKIANDNPLFKWNSSSKDKKYNIINNKKYEDYEKIKKYFQKIKKGNSVKLKSLFEKIEIKDSYPKYPEIKDLIKTRNALKIFRNKKNKNEKVIIDKVIRGLHSLITDNLKINKKWEITHDEFIERLREDAEYIRGIDNFQFKRLLKNKYRDKQDFKYIGLDIIEIKEGQQSQNTEIISLEEPIDILEYSTKLLIYGKAGVGKTTFCDYLSVQWTNENKKIKERFDYVIYLPLRLWKSASLREFIKDIYSKDNDEDTSLIIDSEKTLFLFDGYDELSNKNKEIFKDKIKKNNLQNYIITSRYKKDDKKDDFKDVKFFKIKGFNDTGIESFIDDFFDSQKKRKRIKDFLEKNNNVKNICTVPLLLRMVCTLWQKEESIIDTNITTTEIYSKVIDNILMTHDDENVYFRENRKKIKNILGKLSFESLKNRQVVFSGEEIEKLFNFNEIKFFRKSVIPSGFIKAISENKDILDNDLEFAHLSFQEYFSAYYISYKYISSSDIKKIFAHEDKFFKKFENMIIYLTNIDTRYIDDFIDFDPFIFREHPLLNAKQQERLLLSILDKLQNREWYAWDRVNFFYGSSLVKYDKIDVYSLIKERNINSDSSDILLHYIMRVFAENYSEDNKEFEDFILEKLNQLSKDQYKCQQYISYSYNFNYNYNKKLFDFMQKNKLLKVANNPNDISSMAYIGDKDNPIVENMFLVLYGYKFDSSNKIVEIEQSDFHFTNLLYLLNYIKLDKFQEFTYWFIKLEDIKGWSIYCLDNFENIEKDGAILNKNIAWMFFLIFSVFDFSIESLEKIIHKIVQYRIFTEHEHTYYSVDNRTELSIKNQHVSLLFNSISEYFWQLYFNNKISIDEVTTFIKNYYTININDIHKIVNKYSIEDYFIKVFDLIENLKLNDNKYISILYFPLNPTQKVKLLEVFQNDNSIPIEYIFKLLSYDYWKELEDLVFELLEKFVNNKEKCREYIEQSYNIEYSYNIRLFNFMKKNNLFYKNINRQFHNNEESDYFAKQMYGVLCLENPKKEFFLDKWLYLLNYITKKDFYYIIMDTRFKIEDIKAFFEYINDNNEHLGAIIFRILTDKDSQKIPLKNIIYLFQKFNLTVPKVNMPDFKTNSIPIHPTKDRYIYPLFYTISKEFWNIYFSDDIDSFEQIKDFIGLYDISEKNIELATKQYPIEDYIEKYYDLAVHYNCIYINILMSNTKYYQFIEKKQRNITSLNNLERDLTDIKNYSNKDIFHIFISLDKYDNSYKDEDKQKIFNYLNISKKETIDNDFKSDKNYEKLFWYIINDYNSIENRELFKVIEDKFELFLKVVKEYIEVILEKKNINCFDSSMKWEHNMVYSPCRQIIDIFYNISFDSEQKIWNDFLKYIETKKENEPQYNEFFKLIIDINLTKERLLELIKKNNKDSLSYFETLFQSDMNKALEYFYKYIYDLIPYKISYKLQNNNSPLFSLNYLFSRYLTESNINLKVENSICTNTGSYIDCTNIQTDEEKKINAQKEFKRKLFEFCKDKDCSYNIVKIILFNKLLNLFHYDFDFKNLDKQYIEKILIDYYSLFKEKEVPIAKDFYINNYLSFLSKNDSENYRFFNSNKSKTSQVIISIWGYLQTNINEEKIELLEKLKKNENTYISNSANYALDRAYEKQGKNGSFGKEYYKNIFDKGILPITSSHDLFKVTKEIFDKDIRNWIEEEGAYKFINELSQKENNKNAEDLIQKTLETHIKLGFSERKYESKKIIIKREPQLLDDKRLDFTISYPPFGSLVIELKLAHNNEVKFKQDDTPTKKAEEYKPKLVETYLKGSNSDFGLFVIFNVKDDNTKEEFEKQINNLKKLYHEKNISVIGLNCVK